MSQGWDLLVPGEVFQHTVQEGDADGNGDFGQWRSMGAKIRQPAQNLRIALQLLEPGDLRMMGRQITEEVAKRFLVDPSASVAEGSGERLRRTCKQWFQWMASRVTGSRLGAVVPCRGGGGANSRTESRGRKESVRGGRRVATHVQRYPLCG